MTTTTDTPAVQTVADGRALIDDIDAQIRALVARRRAVSHEVQSLRRSAGGPRIEHSRENEILSRYGDALGRPGVAMAMSILEICRGSSN